MLHNGLTTQANSGTLSLLANYNNSILEEEEQKWDTVLLIRTQHHQYVRENGRES